MGFFSSGVAVLVSTNQFLRETLSSQIEEPQKRNWCISIVARVDRMLARQLGGVAMRSAVVAVARHTHSRTRGQLSGELGLRSIPA